CYPLAAELLKNGLTFLGTIKSNKKEIPPQFVEEHFRLVPGNYMVGTQPDTKLVSMVTQKKNLVLVFSTIHDDNETDET
ncbi:hypothetical protein HHI36_023675, partial [Cryptolaemus montrouzieri]